MKSRWCRSVRGSKMVVRGGFEGDPRRSRARSTFPPCPRSPSLCRKLVKKHPRYLDNSKVKTEQLRRLVGMLIAAQSTGGATSAGASEGPGAASADASAGVDLARMDDLQRVDENVLAAAKAEMGVEFDKNFVGPGHPDFVYDKAVDFGEPESDNEWDDE
mmetsp:Transcript_103221/g.296382  ORF Transcript_103221/g.296382 Transcript_103221/m.296382 type:complete len:160 (-) Transcript_103221:1012-1491(-)